MLLLSTTASSASDHVDNQQEVFLVRTRRSYLLRLVGCDEGLEAVLSVAVMALQERSWM